MSLSASIIGSMILANASSGITPSIVMSRTSDGVSNPAMWVAPCAVVFDGTETTQLGEAHANRKLHFAWDFGDTAQANEFWTAGTVTQCRNKANGSVVGHLYENPGTYYVTLTVVDAAGNVNAVRQQIVVSDPDEVFAGSKTICFSNTTEFTGAPVGATKVTTSSFTDAYAGQIIDSASDKRLMFKCGDTFTIDSATQQKRNVRNIQICSFGVGANAIVDFAEGVTDESVISFSDYKESPTDNIQIFNLTLVNNTANLNKTVFVGASMQSFSSSISGATGRITLYKLNAAKFYLISGGGYGNAVVDCIAGDGNNNTEAGGYVGAYLANCAMSMVAGNYIDSNSSGEHCLRIQGHRRIYVESNTLLNPSNNKVCLAIRGSSLVTGLGDWAASTSYAYGTMRIPISDRLKLFKRVGPSSAQTSGLTEPDWSAALNLGDEVTDDGCIWELVGTRDDESSAFSYISNYANIRNNRCGVPNPRVGYNCTLMVQIACGSPDQNNEPIEDVTFEGNFLDENLTTVLATHKVLEIQIKRATIRNNLFRQADQLSATQGMIIIVGSSSKGTPACDDVLGENNSFYSPHFQVVGVGYTGSGFTNILFRNNLYYAPGSAGNANSKLNSYVGPEIVIENSSTEMQMKTINPGYAVIPPVTAEDFKITSGSYALGAGVGSDGLFVDYFGTTRSRLTAPDMGAIDART